MTKYEKLYGVTVDQFPNERENVEKKLHLATKKRGEIWLNAYSYEQQVELHELTQAIEWCRKILKDINNE
tara:strand:+ start:6241 stop:6450 length:210 start_codon:yes stop_codon:yes gene_type:complete